MARVQRLGQLTLRAAHKLKMLNARISSWQAFVGALSVCIPWFTLAKMTFASGEKLPGRPAVPEWRRIPADHHKQREAPT